jgi:excisionase family DNA binding protein
VDHGGREIPVGADLVMDDDDEAITLPLFSGPWLRDPGRNADASPPQDSAWAAHHLACAEPRRLRTTRAKAAALAPPSAHDRARAADLLTADEAAALLRTSRKAIYAMAERRQLPGITRIGRRLLVRRDVLLSWLDERRAASPGGTRR